VAPAAEPVDMAPGPEVSEVQPEPVTEAQEPEIDMPPPPEPADPVFDSAELQPPPPPTLEPEVVLPEPSKKQPVTEPPKPEVKKKPPPKPRQPDERKDRKQAKPQSKVATAPPRPQAPAAAPAAPAPGAVSSASASPASWRGALLAQLNRAKRYPAEARQNRQEGTVRLSFTIDRSGRVVSYRIVGSSGSAPLDQEALAMIQRASPLPAPPPEIGGAQISLTVPVRFNIN
jgi:protein TonB